MSTDFSDHDFRRSDRVSTYAKLYNLLRSKRWREADIETRRLMLTIVGANQKPDCLLTQYNIQQFPCHDLVQIDQLWRHFSDGRFGFHTIYQIYVEVNKDYAALSERVGWRRGKKWIGYNDVIFTDDAPIGHLPITWLVPTTFWMYWLARFASVGWRLLLERWETCYWTINN
ncbi:MAG: GUN4 domain-containing protein [Coleofasciculus sp. C1-SOL-03]|uniref:GUN4 domain-containing protein n=1 Tax=Coleofasciculus sp. C1-SOL-03 TaxID=3069522 RepID=UPI003301D1AC